MNPIKIFQLEELLGIPGYKNGENCEVLQFRLSDLEGDYCLYDDNKSAKKNEAYRNTSPSSYKETQFVPPETVKYFAECKMKDELPLIFGNVPHLLFKGKIDISTAKILKFQATIKI